MNSRNRMGLSMRWLFALTFAALAEMASAATPNSSGMKDEISGTGERMCHIPLSKVPLPAADAPAPCIPSCTLTANPQTIKPGGDAMLTANCACATSGYSWTGTGFCDSVAGGIVSPTVTTTYSVAGMNRVAIGNASSVTVYVISARPSLVDVHYYVPYAAASSGYVSQLRVMNTGNATTSVSVALIDETSGVVGPAHLLLPAMRAGQAFSFSAQQVEAALGVSLDAAARPRIRVIGAASALKVQSLLLQPGGRISDVSYAESGQSVAVSTYFPAAEAALGYVSYLRVINADNGATPITVARIDPATGLIGATATLHPSLPAGAAVTYGAEQIEAALGSPIAAGERPRILVSSIGAKLDVQSFVRQPGGAFIEMSTSQIGSSIDVRHYAAAARWFGPVDGPYAAGDDINNSAGFGANRTYLRIINIGSEATAIYASVIDSVTGRAGLARTIVENLPPNAAATLSPYALDAAMGAPFDKPGKPRIRLTSSTGMAIQVQSFLQQAKGTFNEMSNAIIGSQSIVSMHIPASDIASGYTTQLHVINPSSFPTDVYIALIDSETGVRGPWHVLLESLPGFAARTYSSAQVEAALGVAMQSGSLPQIQVSGGALEVQSFLIQPGGAVSEVSGGPSGPSREAD